jgi:D-glycero-alpha-D-manno-heptose-7-phosphate kinase
LNIPTETLHNLEDNLVLFFTGFTRSARRFCKIRIRAAARAIGEMLENLHFIKQIGCETQAP